MKKGLKILILILITFTTIKNVYAEIDTNTNYIFPIENTLNQKPNETAINYIYNTLITNYQNKNYIIIYMPFDTSNIYIIFYEESNGDYLEVWGDEIPQLTYHINNGYMTCTVTNDNTHTETCNQTGGNQSIDLLRTRYESSESEGINNYQYYDSNKNIKSLNNFEMTGFYQDNIIVEENGNFPKLKDLYNYQSYSDYEQEHLENYTEVNLDNYEYVLLSLKNYNQTQAFQTNLQIKGQIGITPIYNFGQTSKDSITGVQVQDRCNISYENYTSYPFYIIQSDLQNNAIYAVKECNQGSSFKFDNTVFNITYITQQNKNNPTVTIGDKTYNVIPYEDLPSTATKNEENNYIPGESGSATDTGGLDSAIKNIQKRMSEIWNTFTYFTDFVGQLFSSLPEEVQTILLSAFIVGIIIGLIKLSIK